MSKLGDLTFEILLKVTDAESGAKRVTASLKDVDNAAKQVTQSTSTLSGKLSNMGFVLNGVREAGQILSSSLRTIFSTIKSSNDAYQEYLSSNRQLSAAVMDWDLIKKNSLKNQEEQKKSTEEQKNTNVELDKTVGVNKQVSNSNRVLKDSYEELKEAVRTFGDIIKELNGDRTVGELTDRLLRQKEIDESRGRVRGFYGSDDKDKSAAEAKSKKEASKVPEAFEKSLSLSQQLTGILGLGADNFSVKFLGTLQDGLSLANSFANLLLLILGGGSGGIFSLLGFASGGSVPGSGSGDTVPAMLTPGEFVINKSAASRLGPWLLQLLNGGGTVTSLPSFHSGGGASPIIINVTGDMTSHLAWSIVDKGSKARNVRIKKSNF